MTRSQRCSERFRALLNCSRGTADSEQWKALGGQQAPAASLLKDALAIRKAITEFDLASLPTVQVKGVPALPLRMAIEQGRVRFFFDRAAFHAPIAVDLSAEARVRRVDGHHAPDRNREEESPCEGFTPLFGLS